MSRRESKLGVKLAGGLEGEVTPWAGVSLLVELGRQCGVTETAERVLPPGPWQIGVRSDSAAYEQRNLDGWDHRGWKFAVSADMTRALRIEIEALPEGTWKGDQSELEHRVGPGTPALP